MTAVDFDDASRFTNRKAPGSDGINTGLLKYGSEGTKKNGLYSYIIQASLCRKTRPWTSKKKMDKTIPLDSERVRTQYLNCHNNNNNVTT
jgi:hypothetical protein